MALGVALFQGALVDKVGVGKAKSLARDSVQLEMNEYDKLEPCWQRCRANGISIGDYFEDSVVNPADVPRMLEFLRQSFSLIAQRKPFFHKDDANKTFGKMVQVLELAESQNKGIFFICD